MDVGQVEDAVLGRVLGVEHDLQQQVAELLGELRRRALLERVVDLVRLLEQELAQRQVVLLAIPRAAIGRAQARHEPGQAVRAGDVGERLERRACKCAPVASDRRRQLADGRVRRAVEAVTRVVGRIERAQHLRGVRAVGCAAGQRDGSKPRVAIRRLGLDAGSGSRTSGHARVERTAQQRRRQSATGGRQRRSRRSAPRSSSSNPFHSMSAYTHRARLGALRLVGAGSSPSSSAGGASARTMIVAVDLGRFLLGRVPVVEGARRGRSESGPGRARRLAFSSSLTK